MPFLEDKPHSRGISLPPSGWVLAVLLVIYIFTGLIGHDPWKHDDAVTIGVAHDIAEYGNWLLLQLAGRPFPAAPLYYWLAAGVGRLFSWVLPFHDAARMTSGIFTLLSLQFILLAAREMFGREHAAAAPLILAGSIGFLFHAHEAQPMLAALTAHAAAYWALALLPRRPRLACGVFSAAMAVCFMAGGLLPLLALLPATTIAIWKSEQRLHDGGWLLAATALAAVPCGLWLSSIYLASPDYFIRFFDLEFATLTRQSNPAANLMHYADLLMWYAWPALPLAAWSLWSKRRSLATTPFAMPALAFLSIIGALALFVAMRRAPALLMLPPLVLLAVPGAVSLRRGAANAFDWFGMVTFTFFAAIAWIGWSALVFGWPARLARQALRLEPGFVGHFSAPAFVFATLCTGIWFWLIATSPRSPMRGVMHWMAGITLFWLLLASLWMPWIDYGKTYRTVTTSLRAALPEKPGCIAGASLPLPLLATVDYFEDIRILPQKSEEAALCSWLLVQGNFAEMGSLAGRGWVRVWEGHRAADRRDDDRFHLFHRGKKAQSAPGLTGLPAESSLPADATLLNRVPPE